MGANSCPLTGKPPLQTSCSTQLTELTDFTKPGTHSQNKSYSCVGSSVVVARRLDSTKARDSWKVLCSSMVACRKVLSRGSLSASCRVSRLHMRHETAAHILGVCCSAGIIAVHEADALGVGGCVKEAAQQRLPASLMQCLPPVKAHQQRYKWHVTGYRLMIAFRFHREASCRPHAESPPCLHTP
jgi:hypothetical protein